jgi:hypothetical protein
MTKQVYDRLGLHHNFPLQKGEIPVKGLNAEESKILGVIHNVPVYIKGVDPKRPTRSRVLMKKGSFSIIETAPFEVILSESLLKKMRICIDTVTGDFYSTARFDSSEFHKGAPWVATSRALNAHMEAELLLLKQMKRAEREGDATLSRSLKGASTLQDLHPDLLRSLSKQGLVPVEIPDIGVAAVGDSLTREQIADFVADCTKFASVFGKMSGPSSKLPVRDIDLVPGYVPPKVRFSAKNNPLNEEVLRLNMKKGMLALWDQKVLGTSRWFLTRKPGHPTNDVRGWRLVADIGVNKGVVKDSYPLASPMSCAAQLARSRFFFKTDIADAYGQFPLSEKAKAMVCLLTKLGTLTFTGQPNGLKNSQSHTLRALTLKVFPECISTGLVLYVDNMAQGALDVTTLRSHFISVLAKCAEFGLKLNIGDTVFGAEKLEFLGFEITEGQYGPSSSHHTAITQMPLPKTQKDLRSFLAAVVLYKSFVPNFNSLEAKLRALEISTSKGEKLLWSEEHKAAFHRLRAVFCDKRVLTTFDPNLPTRMNTDWNGWKEGESPTHKSRPGISAVIRQKQPDGRWAMVAAFSRYLTAPEVNAITKEKAFSSSVGESIALAWALDAGFPLLSQVRGFDILVDSRNLSWFKSSISPIMIRLRQRISLKYDLDHIRIRHITRSQNQLADMMARLALEPQGDESISLTVFAGIGIEGDFIPHTSMALQTVCTASCPLEPRDPTPFSPDLFSEEETKAWLARKAIATANGLLYKGRSCVPLSAQREVLLGAHIDTAGGHRTAKQTRALLAQYAFHDSTYVSNSLKLCEACVSARHPIKEVDWSSSGPRPSRVGECVALDFKQVYIPSQSYTLTLATMLDIYSGVLWAHKVPHQNGEGAISAISYLRRQGIPVQSIYMDQARAFRVSHMFRSYLTEHGLTPFYSKGYDPQHIASLERAHGELGTYYRSLPPSVDQDDTSILDNFLISFNHLELDCGITRSELAYGSSPTRSNEIARRLRSLTQSMRDDRTGGEDNVFVPGTIASRMLEPRSKTDKRGELVRILSRTQGSALCEPLSGGLPTYTPMRRLRLKLNIGDSGDVEDLYIPRARHSAFQAQDPEDPPAHDRPALIPRDHWVVYLDNSRPYVGVAQDQGRGGILLHEHRLVGKEYLPVWNVQRDGTEENIVLRSRPKDSDRVNWNIPRSQVAGHAKRNMSRGKKYNLPQDLVQLVAKLERDRPDRPDRLVEGDGRIVVIRHSLADHIKVR